MADRKTNLLITMVFDKDLDIGKQVDTELALKKEITKDLQHLITSREIKHFVLADDEAINEKLTEECKQGEWIIDEEWKISGRIEVHCSACGKDPEDFVSGYEDWWITRPDVPKYCPFCGSRNELRGN